MRAISNPHSVIVIAWGQGFMAANQPSPEGAAQGHTRVSLVLQTLGKTRVLSNSHSSLVAGVQAFLPITARKVSVM